MNEVEMREDLITYISDAWKDVHGSRPRFDMSSMTNADLKDMADRLGQEIEEQICEERGYFEEGIQKAIEAGAGDRETAIRWLQA